jgi:hypothetical protein
LQNLWRFEEKDYNLLSNIRRRLQYSKRTSPPPPPRLPQYDFVKVDIITNFGVGASVGTDNGFQRTVEAGRKSEVRMGRQRWGQ